MKWSFNLENIFSIQNNLSKPGALSAYIDKLFAKKPHSLGEGLARIKKVFGIVEQKEPLMLDSRRYIAKDGSTVWFNNLGSSLSIHKEVQPVTGSAYNEIFSKKLASLHKYYMNIKFGDEVHMDRSINVELFKPLKKSDIKSNITIATHNIDRPGVKEIGYNGLRHIHYHNTKDIPYTKACSMGLKV